MIKINVTKEGPQHLINEVPPYLSHLIELCTGKMPRVWRRAGLNFFYCKKILHRDDSVFKSTIKIWNTDRYLSKFNKLD